MPRVFLIWFAIIFGCASSIAAVDCVEIHLRSGDIVTGELVSMSDATMEVKTTIVGKSGSRMSATVSYNRGDIASFTHIEDPEEAYQSRARAARTADEVAMLAVWCREHAMADHALEQAKRAIGMDVNQSTATQLLTDLGWVVVDGRCQTEASWLAAQGKVRYHGTIMTIVAADALKAQEEQQHAQADALTAQKGLATRIGIEERQLADLEKSMTANTARIAATNKALQAAQEASQKITTTKAAFDAAESDLANAQAAAHGQPAGSSSPALIAARIADDKTQRAYLDAKEAAGGVDQLIAQLHAQLAVENTEHDRLAKQQAELVTAHHRDLAQLAHEAPGDAKAGDTTTLPAPAPTPRTAPP